MRELQEAIAQLRTQLDAVQVGLGLCWDDVCNSRSIDSLIAFVHQSMQNKTQIPQYKSEVEAKYARREGKARVGAMQRVFVQEVGRSIVQPAHIQSM